MLLICDHAGANSSADSIRQEIARLEQERDAATGLLAFMKRKKIQKQIDELEEKLRRL